MFVLNGNSEKIVGLLKKCGLTEYESKAYFTLLLTDREKMGNLCRRSGIPQSKIYWVVEGLESKGLVNQVNDFPKTVSALPLEPYLSMAINSKQKEIAEIVYRGKELQEITRALKPVAEKFKSYKVFEPKYRRRRF